MELKSYDIVLLPEEGISSRAIELSEDASRFDTHFTLGSEEYFPHLSLYMFQTDKEGLEKTLQILNEISAKTKNISVKSSKYHFESGYFDVEFGKTSELTDIQEEVIKNINPIRSGLRKKDEDRLLTVNGEEKDNIQKFGYRSVGNLFFPHLTFTRFKDDNMNTLKDLPAVETFDGKFTSLGIFEMGEHGTCRTKVNTWTLV